MSTTNTNTAVTKKIDDIAAKALEIFNGADMDFEKELSVAQAMGDMRKLLTPQVMEPVMALMNSPLGFMTDQNPATRNDARPYSVEVVRDCFIEAKLRGFHAVGNEFNIIAGRFYGAKAGMIRKVNSFPGVSGVKDTYEVPRLVGDKGAIVKCKITWVRDGKPDGLEREFPVKVNQYMGSDAILGKCQRKLYAAALSHLTGKPTPDGEVGETPDAPPQEVPKPVFGTSTTVAADSASLSELEKSKILAKEKAEAANG